MVGVVTLDTFLRSIYDGGRLNVHIPEWCTFYPEELMNEISMIRDEKLLKKHFSFVKESEHLKDYEVRRSLREETYNCLHTNVGTKSAVIWSIWVRPRYDNREKEAMSNEYNSKCIY